jgi:hypothetical protein
MHSENVRLFGGVGDVWKEIGKLTGKPRLAAIAYLGDNAPYLLGEFGPNDVVVCDASDGSVKSGSTSRKALNDLVDRGVHVYSLRNLHAKIVCIGKTAVVGSMNASASSTSMHEAAVLLKSDQDVRHARLLIKRFVAQSTEVDAQFLRRLGKMKVNNRNIPHVPIGVGSRGSEYITIGAVQSAKHPKYVKEAADKTFAAHKKFAGFRIKTCVAERGERRSLNIGELVVWVYSDKGDNPRLEIGRIIDYEKIRDRWIYFDLTPTKVSSVNLNQLKKILATMQFKGGLDELGSEWRRIRLPGIEAEIERLFGKSAPPKS